MDKSGSLDYLCFESRVSVELAIFDSINGWYNLNRRYFKLCYMYPNEFEVTSHSNVKIKFNSAKWCEKFQLVIELINIAVAAPKDKVSKLYGIE